MLDARTRPNLSPVLLQNWTSLLFLHWKYPAAQIQSRIPPDLVVDTFRGDAYLGLVAFRMESVRPNGIPALPWISHFLELNVRTYVRTAAGEPGVWFFSLDCNRLPAVLIARTLFGLPYESAAMAAPSRTEIQCQRKGILESARYAWTQQRVPEETIPGSLEFFLAERYNFFSQLRRRMFRGQVHHAPYPLSDAQVSEWSDLPLRWNGFDVAQRPPDHTHCSPGVSVEAFPLCKAIQRHP
jgi:hypothetical protein